MKRSKIFGCVLEEFVPFRIIWATRFSLRCLYLLEIRSIVSRERYGWIHLWRGGSEGLTVSWERNSIVSVNTNKAVENTNDNWRKFSHAMNSRKVLPDSIIFKCNKFSSLCHTRKTLIYVATRIYLYTGLKLNNDSSSSSAHNCSLLNIGLP